ncbi:hypothetical protein GCM10027053_02850 [Intrasporangium mesophilum]
MRRRSLPAVIMLVSTCVALPAGPAGAKQVDDWRLDSRPAVGSSTVQSPSATQSTAQQASGGLARVKPTPVRPTTVTVGIPVAKSGSTSAGASSSGPKPSTSARPGSVVAAELTREGTGFDVAGVTFSGPAPKGLTVEARTRSSRGWSSWTELDVEPDEGPDARSAEGRRAVHGTSPLVAAQSNGIQVRVLTTSGDAPRDLNAALVDGGSSAADATMAGIATANPSSARTALSATSATSGTSGTASGSVLRPAIITRAQWGADESMRPCTPEALTGYQAAVVHHTVDSNTYTAEQAASVIRGIYAYHTQKLLWCDIGYQFLVDRFGRVYEGRVGGLDGFVLGAQAGGFNSTTFGVSVMGDFTTIAFPPAVLTAVSDVIAWQADRAGFDPSMPVVLTSGGSTRYPVGTVITVPRVMGHRDLSATECPGDRAYPQVPAIRSQAAASWLAGQGPRYVAATAQRIAGTLQVQGPTGTPSTPPRQPTRTTR